MCGCRQTVGGGCWDLWNYINPTAVCSQVTVRTSCTATETFSIDYQFFGKRLMFVPVLHKSEIHLVMEKLLKKGPSALLPHATYWRDPACAHYKEVWMSPSSKDTGTGPAVQPQWRVKGSDGSASRTFPWQHPQNSISSCWASVLSFNNVIIIKFVWQIIHLRGSRDRQLSRGFLIYF